MTRERPKPIQPMIKIHRVVANFSRYSGSLNTRDNWVPFWAKYIFACMQHISISSSSRYPYGLQWVPVQIAY